MTGALSLNRRAARAVALYGRDVDDKRLLLDVLGLVDGPTGREVLPDDVSNNTLPEVATAITPTDSVTRRPAPEAEGMRDRSAVPAGLRALPTTPPSSSPGTTKSRRTHPQETPVSTPPVTTPGPPAIDLPDTTAGPYIAALRACELFADPAYQRPLDAARVKRMAATWDPKMLGVLDVADRGTQHAAGTRFAIINGQHRVAAALQAVDNPADLWVACDIHEGLDAAGEAALMYELDRGTKALTSWDQWRARRAAGDPVVLDVEAVATSVNMKVHPGSFGAVGAAEKLVRRGGRELLQATVSLLVSAYGPTSDAVHAPVLTGLGGVLADHAEDVAADRVIRALRTTSPQQLRAEAAAVRAVDGGSLHALVRRRLTALYNRTAGEGPKLPGARA